MDAIPTKSMQAWAARYIEKYRLALVPIPLGHKFPLREGWNKPGGYVTEIRDWPANHGIGAVLEPSGLCSLDVDSPEHAERVLAELGIDLSALRVDTPTIQGNPARYRLMFQAPAGVALSRKTLVWPAKQVDEKPITIFELRAGDIQDVLPPTVHPDTGKPYVWLIPPNSEFPPLPKALLELWQQWGSYSKDLAAMCPWAPHGFNPEAAPRGSGGRPNVIAAFNDAHPMEELIEAHGYKRRGNRWLSPTSTSGLAGVRILDSSRVYSSHASDPLADDHAHDAFDVFRILDHGGDTKAAIKAAAEALGITEEQQKPSAANAWPEPQPIQAVLHPVPAFDAETLLPEALRGWIVDESDRMPCPPDFIAAAALVSLGAIIGARCAIKPKSRDDWLIVPNLWGGIVGLPSAKKSPAAGAAMKPVGRLIMKAMKEHGASMDAFESAKVVFEAKEDAIEARIKAAAKDAKKGNLDSLAKELQSHRQQPPEEPILRRYKTNDTTVEKLGELLRDNPTGLLVLRDELVGLLASWEREGHEGDRAFYLEAWNGNASFDIDRIKRGSIFIPNLCASIFGGIQPDKLTAYLEQATHELANDGMLQRFQLLVYPDHCPWEWRDRIPNTQARDRAFDVFEALAEFNPAIWGAAPVDDFHKFPHFRFDEEALEIFIEWSGDLHRSKLPAEENPIIAQHLAKYDKLMPALALVECAASGQRGSVTREAALRAAAWCEYLEAHARRCYGMLADDGLRAAQALADKVRLGKLVDGFTAWEVRRKQRRYLTASDGVHASLGWLEEEGWIRGVDDNKGQGAGRSTRRYMINPKISAPLGNSTVNTAFSQT